MICHSLLGNRATRIRSNEKLTSSWPCKNGLYDDFEEWKPKKVPWRDLKSVLKSGYRFWLFTQQTDDWNSLRKNKFHPPLVLFHELFCIGWLSVCSPKLVSSQNRNAWKCHWRKGFLPTLRCFLSEGWFPIHVFRGFQTSRLWTQELLYICSGVLWRKDHSFEAPSFRFWCRVSRSAGFNKTSSGETLCCPVKSGIFLSISKSARSNGVAPLRLSLAVELIWLAIRFISSWVYLYMLLPFGIT